MTIPPARLGPYSSWGLFLVWIAAIGLAFGALVHWKLGKPTILEARPNDCGKPPRFFERLSVHLVIYAVWGIGFGLIICRGLPFGMVDPRFAFERSWPVVQNAEWVYLTSYLVPLALPWLPVERGPLRRYCLNLWWLLGLCCVIYLVIPMGPQPRPFVPSSPGGTILAWDTTRPDFAAAGLPSFHVCWALLCAGLLATLGRSWAILAYTWAICVAVSCVATGAHALADIVAAILIYWLVASSLEPTLMKAEALVFGKGDVATV